MSFSYRWRKFFGEGAMSPGLGINETAGRRRPVFRRITSCRTFSRRDRASVTRWSDNLQGHPSECPSTCLI